MREDEVKEAIKRRLVDNVKDACEEASIVSAIAGSEQNEDFIAANCDDKAEDINNNEQNDVPSINAEEVEGEDEKDNKQSFGKFKNPQELLRAYGELEREFTKKSQRLKQLEREAQEPFSTEEEWKEAVDNFFEKTPSAKAFAKDIANEILSKPELKKDKNCLDIALTRVLIGKFKTPEELMSDGQFLDNYVLCSDRVKDAIIAKYLDEVREGQPPKTLSSGGLQCVAPNRKPKTIEEAGAMFLKNNK